MELTTKERKEIKQLNTYSINKKSCNVKPEKWAVFLVNCFLVRSCFMDPAVMGKGGWLWCVHTVSMFWLKDLLPAVMSFSPSQPPPLPHTLMGGLHSFCRHFWLLQLGMRCKWHSWVEARGADKHPTVHRTVPSLRENHLALNINIIGCEILLP